MSPRHNYSTKYRCFDKGRHLREAGGPSPPLSHEKEKKKKERKKKKKREKREKKKKKRKKKGNYVWITSNYNICDRLPQNET